MRWYFRIKADMKPAMKADEKGAIMTATAVKKKVSVIPAKPQYDREVKLTDKKLKVAAYCRVSTALEEQESSYEARLNIIPRR